MVAFGRTAPLSLCEGRSQRVRLIDLVVPMHRRRLTTESGFRSSGNAATLMSMSDYRFSARRRLLHCANSDDDRTALEVVVALDRGAC